MTLLLNNEEIESVLTMKECMDALEILYEETGQENAGGFPRQDVHVNTKERPEYPDDPVAHYTKTMGGASPHFGVSAVRMSSDIIRWSMINGRQRRIKIPAAPGGKWLGLILIYSSETGELLGMMNDGFLSRMRVGGTNGVAAKVLARKDAKTVGLFGSGWQAGSQLMALCEIRDIQKIKVYSPTQENREKFAKEMSEQLKVEVVPVSDPKEAAKEVDILVTATNSRQPFLPAEWVQSGMHISSLQRDELMEEAYRKIDHLVVNSKQVEWNFTSNELNVKYEDRGFEIRDHPHQLDVEWSDYPLLGEMVVGKVPGRQSDEQITGFINNIGYGAQFAAVGARVLQLAKEKGLGRELPTEWFLQDIHP